LPLRPTTALQSTLFPYTTLFRSEVRRILTDQRDVGAVQRRHDLQVPLALEHLLRKPGGRGVRDRIVRMHQLQLLAQREELQLMRSEEHTSELQSPDHLVCRLLLE